MPPELKYIVDANLPFRISLFNSPEFVSARDLGLERKDSSINNYALAHCLTIISRDVDFYKIIHLMGTPPKLIWIHAHDLSVGQTAHLLSTHWPSITALLERSSVVEVHRDKIISSKVASQNA